MTPSEVDLDFVCRFLDGQFARMGNVESLAGTHDLAIKESEGWEWPLPDKLFLNLVEGDTLSITKERLDQNSVEYTKISESQMSIDAYRRMYLEFGADGVHNVIGAQYSTEPEKYDV